jgi:hypothetical protein
MSRAELIQVRISLSEKDFADLVAGKVVRPERMAVGHDDRVPAFTHSVSVEIALQDIGWDRMVAAIDTAMANRGE